MLEIWACLIDISLNKKSFYEKNIILENKLKLYKIELSY
jgi:hypothetical protein